jgi:hypothetical protein
VREADRFVESALGKETPSTVIILGEGLGYASEAVERRHPGAAVIRVHYSSETFRACGVTGAAWHPDEGTGLLAFLRSRIDDLDAEGLRVIEWPAAARIYPAVARMANEAVRQVVRELNGTLVTTIAMGRLWLRNSIANFLSLKPVLCGMPCAPDRLLVIAAAGPSLERSLSLLADSRGSFDLWALASSLPALHAAGLAPDLVVMTDPSHYSIHHLSFARLSCPVALPLSAARGLWNALPEARTAEHVSPHGARGNPPGAFLLAQAEFFEKALLGAAGLAAPRVEPHGTVATTALDLALASTSGPVVFAGLDMCNEDLLSHARPNAFDNLFHASATRLSPHYSRLFHMAQSLGSRPLDEEAAIAGEKRTRHYATAALRTYAGWLAGRSSSDASRIFRLFPSPVPLPGMRVVEAPSFRRLADGEGQPKAGPRLGLSHAYPTLEKRRAIARRLLDEWSDELKRAGRRSASRSQPTILLERAADRNSPSRAADSLLYYIEPRLLLEARMKQRLGNNREALAALVRACDEGVSFLGSLAAKVFGDR